MRRVHTIYVLRKLFNPLAYRLYLLVVLVGGLASFVSISNVVANMPRYGGVFDFYNFSVYAFMHTELMVQVMVLGIVVTMLWFVFDLTRKLLLQTRVVSV